MTVHRQIADRQQRCAALLWEHMSSLARAQQDREIIAMSRLVRARCAFVLRQAAETLMRAQQALERSELHRVLRERTRPNGYSALKSGASLAVSAGFARISQ